MHCCRTKRSTLDMLGSCGTMTQKSAKRKSSNLDHSQEVLQESFWTKILLSFHSCASVIDHQNFQCMNVQSAITTVFTLFIWMQRRGGDSCFIAQRMVQCCAITTYHQNSSTRSSISTGQRRTSSQIDDINERSFQQGQVVQQKAHPAPKQRRPLQARKSMHQ